MLEGRYPLRLKQALGRQFMEYRPDRFSALPLPLFLQVATSRQMLARVRRNLKGIYLQSEEAQNTLKPMQRMAMVAPHAAIAPIPVLCRS